MVQVGCENSACALFRQNITSFQPVITIRKREKN